MITSLKFLWDDVNIFVTLVLVFDISFTVRDLPGAWVNFRCFEYDVMRHNPLNLVHIFLDVNIFVLVAVNLVSFRVHITVFFFSVGCGSLYSYSDLPHICVNKSSVWAVWLVQCLNSLVCLLGLHPYMPNLGKSSEVHKQLFLCHFSMLASPILVL